MFDVDTSGHIFIYDAHNSGLHCYKFNGKNIWHKYLSRDILDFKYYDGKLFLYTGDSLIAYSANDFKFQAVANLAQNGMKVAKVGNISKFGSNVLLMADFSQIGFETTFKYLVSLDSLKLIKEVNEKSPTLLITNCSNCDIKKIGSVLFSNAMLGYSFLGQSDSYIFFNKLYNKDGEKDYTSEFYALKKADGSVREFKDFKEDVFLLSIRPFFAVNDTTVIFHENKSRKSSIGIDKVIFYTLTFNSW